MSKELENQIKSLQSLAYTTMNPIFIASYLNVKRTGKVLILGDAKLEKQEEQIFGV